MRKGVVCQEKGVPRVCFGGFRLPARSPAMRDEGRPDGACGGVNGSGRGVPHFGKEELRKAAGDFT